MILNDKAADIVLVAGGAGFVGSAIVRLLAIDGHQVFVADNLSFGSRSNVEGIGDNVHFIKHDFYDCESTMELIKNLRPKYAVSCVGDTFVTSAYSDPRRFINNNLIANLNIIQGCANKHCARFIYLSSTEIYGDATEGALNESAALGPVNTYAATKLAADRIAYTYAIEHGANISIARIFNTYGPRETHAYIVPEIIDQLSKSDELLLGNIDACRDFTFVDDTARAICLLLKSDIPNGSAFNIGSNVQVRIKDIAAAISRAMGKSYFTLKTDPARLRRRDVESFRCDFKKLQEVTGWVPEVSLDEGLRKTVDWFRQNGSTWPWDNGAREERNYDRVC